MEQRDLLKDQIEQLGKVLARIMSDFLRLKSSGNATQAIQAANEKLQNLLDINTESLLSLPSEALKEYLNRRKLSVSHIETLAEYLMTIGIEKKKTDKPSGEAYLNKAIVLLNVADEVSNMLSLERINQKEKIKKMFE
jgi:hypothetical protein